MNLFQILLLAAPDSLETQYFCYKGFLQLLSERISFSVNSVTLYHV